MEKEGLPKQCINFIFKKGLILRSVVGFLLSTSTRLRVAR